MTTKHAKDFLVQQTAEQAARENVALSEIEKKMMYFTESDPASCADPIKINDEFEAQCDNAEYEAKISKLLHHACKRLKEENPEGKHNWDEAVRTLRKGDHYILVLLDVSPQLERPPHDRLKLIGTALLVVGVGVGYFALAAKLGIDTERYGRLLLYLLVLIALVLIGPGRVFFRRIVDRFRR